MWFLCVLLCLLINPAVSYLYPLESESRQVKSLNGLWWFNYGDQGFTQKWYEKDLKNTADRILMPVPGSFNEITVDNALRDYLGWVWYQREFYLGKKWAGSRVFVYFGAADHHALVWCNGVEVGKHVGGHTSFHIEITNAVKWDERNMLTVAVNNTLTPFSLPQGFTVYPNDSSRYPPGTRLYSHNCDYFDYAGINRNVFIYSVPFTYIKDLDIVSKKVRTSSNYSLLQYEIKLNIYNATANCSILLTDQHGGYITSSFGCKGALTVRKKKELIWLPGAPHLYNAIVTIESGKFTDIYKTFIGSRTIDWENSDGLRINGLKMYFKGFGMHEDADIRGRGYDDAISTRDISLLKWTGANIIRTSHYPYSEEFLRQCDIWGIAVILEVPACSLQGFSEELYQEHERITLEIISEYKHHPSIIMWSLANEPASNDNSSTAYFKKLYDVARAADPTRPVTFVTSQKVDKEKAIGAMDVILINRYSGWYQDGGGLDLIEYQVQKEIHAWHKKYNKSVMISEYGAGSIPGQHSLVPSMWTEDYHVSLLKKHFEVYDKLREKGLLSGEMIWNLIDFKTPQEYIRPGFCMKGIFSRQREPKAAAHVVRQRYRQLNSI